MKPIWSPLLEWDKNDLDALGILKVDCLALGMLTAIRKAFALIENSGHPAPLSPDLPGAGDAAGGGGGGLHAGGSRPAAAGHGGLAAARGDGAVSPEAAFGDEGQRLSRRLGLRMIGGLAVRDAQAIVQTRQDGPFASFPDFVRRTNLRSPALRKLAQADAFGSLGLSRRQALWLALLDTTSMPLFDNISEKEVAVELPKMLPFKEVLADYGTVGLTLREHPISFLRASMDKHGVTPAAGLWDLKHGQSVIAAGLVLLRQRPSTAKGITFVTLEDETGVVNLIVRQKIWEQYRRAARAAVVMVAHGELQRDGEVMHVLVKRIEDWSNRFADLEVRSRDFR